jgi:hypothetical protein
VSSSTATNLRSGWRSSPRKQAARVAKAIDRNLG